MSDDLIFVYGTLRMDTASPMKPILDQYCTLLGRAFMTGKLYDLGRYPGVVLDASDMSPVYGQLFQLSDVEAVLTAFDQYEECSAEFPFPHLYRREKVTVNRDTGTVHSAWVYIYNRSVAGCIHIPEGDYVRYISGENL